MTRVYFEEMKAWIDVDFRLTKDEVDYLIRLLNEVDMRTFYESQLLDKLVDIHNFYDDYPLKDENEKDENE